MHKHRIVETHPQATATARPDLSVGTRVLLLVVLMAGCKTQESLSGKYRNLLIEKLKDIQALDLSAEVVPGDEQAALDFSLKVERANAVMLYDSEIAEFDLLIDNGESLPTFQEHIPFEFFSSTANAVLSNEWTSIPTLAAFERNLRVITNAKYVAIIELIEETAPHTTNAGLATQQHFKGSVEGRISVFQIASRKMIAQTLFSATNSEEVSVRHLGDGSTDDQQAIKDDLNANIGKAIKAGIKEVLPNTKFE